jgi:hypothetical protein
MLRLYHALLYTALYFYNVFGVLILMSTCFYYFRKPKRVGKSSKPSAAKSRKVEQTAPVAYPRVQSPQYESSEESDTQYEGFVVCCLCSVFLN